ncbi:MAG: alpha/beta hydrolase, partial [Marivirga sp.]|nr:alpha/beta hydrolase [Marivirga sp.]
MTEKFLRYKKSSLHYINTGSGSKILLVFHGFGQDHKVFRELTESLSGIYTIYLFDLYFHGKSEWGYDELPLEKEHWKDTIQQFLNENEIEKFCLAGFSLGGKFVLSTLESFPSKTEEVFLLAPDGIKTSSWYSLATYPIIFRKIFKSMIRHHGRF